MYFQLVLQENIKLAYFKWGLFLSWFILSGLWLKKCRVLNGREIWISSKIVCPIWGSKNLLKRLPESSLKFKPDYLCLFQWRFENCSKGSKALAEYHAQNLACWEFWRFEPNFPILHPKLESDCPGEAQRLGRSGHGCRQKQRNRPDNLEL